ncbi:M1 family metallopeptidase [Rhodocytophaga aerolata]|uniref:M1 family metallopeptidase n=1 Tax=Rhodocytophaga aerolata TaxID=455078 RepID=A0ABT8RFR9_9BACT|nr:M1 family metallopeptidase [Rhodocytophaga aerolata]MDO1450948.1 M1 family metallopeptidase [Rhodocytophaga aerolata]
MFVNLFRKSLFLLFLLSVSASIGYAQQKTYTRQDSLRGTITPERAWWDLTYYHLSMEVNPADSSIRGVNQLQYKVLTEHSLLQLDLQPPMEINKVLQKGKELTFRREGNVYWIEIPQKQTVGSVHELSLVFGGKPQVSKRPPWSGGITWQKDSRGNPFIASSCQGDGASLWWPCKDHMYDEPDSMLISVKVPKNLMDVSNGRLRKVDRHKDGSKTFHWFVSNPINNYGVNINIGDYVQFSEKYSGEKGQLDCTYYVLRDNLAKAKEQFKEAKRMLAAFEHWFGPYPFYEDGYKLVEAPYLGMEHQSSVTYGNGYQNGYLGRDLSQTGYGLKFDFIIVHESGHEWFANNITYRDVADMWIHESFTAYSENLFLDYHFSKEASAAYVLGTRSNILNDRPIIGDYGVNKSGSGDMYYKGANMLHTLRQIVNDDKKWREILRGMNQAFYHQTVTSEQIENYLSKAVGRELTPFFTQYLRTVQIPALEYRLMDNKLYYRWGSCVEGFAIPVRVWLNKREQWLEPTKAWQSLTDLPANTSMEVDPNFYVIPFNLTTN